MAVMTSLWLATSPPLAQLGFPFAPDMCYDTVVVGAGLTGVTTALLLARAGQRVVLLEAETPGVAATGNATGKLGFFQGAALSRIRRHQGDAWLRARVTVEREAQAWLLNLLSSEGIDHQIRSSITYAVSSDGWRTLLGEFAAARVAGVDAEWVTDTGLPFAVLGAIEVSGQAQFHPMQLLTSMLNTFAAHGGVLHTACRVESVSAGRPCTVATSLGTIHADHVVVATGTPPLGRRGRCGSLTTVRSYAIAFRAAGAVPQGMYLSVDDPVRSLRTAPSPHGEVMVVGGHSQVVGRDDPEAARVDLEQWTRRTFPGAQLTHAWSLQEFRSASSLPYVGSLAGSGGTVLVATGYDKWGSTNGVAAALRMAGEIVGARPAWAEPVRSSATVARLTNALVFGEVRAGAPPSQG